MNVGLRELRVHMLDLHNTLCLRDNLRNAATVFSINTLRKPLLLLGRLGQSIDARTPF